MRDAGLTKTAGRARRARTARSRVVLSLLAAALLALALSASASALSQRGHVFSEALSFGGPGSGDGQFNNPSGVAVNEATGDVYVVDSGNNRIERFNAAHEFISAWGFGVKDGEKNFEVCTSGCRAGLAGKAKGELHGAGAIAVDNSGGPSQGDVYVEAVTPFEEEVKGKEIETEYAQFDKFTATGEVEGKPEVLSQIKSFKDGIFGTVKFEEPHGITVGPDGKVWVYNEELLVGYSGDTKNKFLKIVESEASGEERNGLAVDPTAGSKGGFYVAHELEGGEAPTVIAKEHVVEEEGAEKKLEFLGVPLVEALDTNNTTGVAAESVTGNVFLDHGTSVAELDKSAEPVQSFGAEHLVSGTGLAVDRKNEAVLVADAGAGRIVGFEAEPEGAPLIDELAAAETSATASTLTALIDPHGSATEYAFRYSTGAVPVATLPCNAPCVQVPASPVAIGSGFGDVEAKLTEAHLTELSPATVYHYRVYAKNEAGGTEHLVEAGELTFKTQAEAIGESLPDGRQYQLVSPKRKNGAAIQGLTGEGGLVQAAADGSGITYVTEGAVGGTCSASEEEPEGTRAPEVTQLLSSRGASGWCTRDIDTPHNEAEGVTPGGAPEYRWFAEDLSSALVEPYGTGQFEHPKLSAEANERTPYLRHSATCAAGLEGCFQPLARPTNVPAETKYGSKIEFVAGTPDMSHLVVRSTVHLTEEEAPAGENLYEWAGGQFKLVNVLPSGKAVAGAALGFPLSNGRVLRNAISSTPEADGTRYVFTAASHLYMRDMTLGAGGETIQIDKGEEVPQAAGRCTTNPTQCEHPIFQTASTDGSVVFFTDEQRLTAGAGANAERPDLYACQVTPAGCHLTDLTPEPKAGESANVQGTVIGASEDGTAVYFVANGALNGAHSGNCRAGEGGLAKESGEDPEALTTGGVCTLFVDRFEAGPKAWAAPKPLAQLSSEDEFDWRSPILLQLTSRVSPNGAWLAFMSDRNLTSYNARDKISNRGAEEVYLYNAAADKVVCASCNPTGARPEGIFDKEFSGEGIGLLVDRPLEWTKRWLAANVPAYTKLSLNNAYYQSRYLDDQGRLYFNSAEGLVPQDKNGKEDAYQYESLGPTCTEAGPTFVESANGCVALISSGTSTKESAFIDASTTGQDAFFISSAPLVESDTDTSYDVYDATVCGSAGRPACLAPPVATPKACLTADECRPSAPGAPPSGGSVSEGPSSGEDVSGQKEVLGSKEEVKPKPVVKPLTRAQKLAKALKACKKLKSKSKRHACEVQARKKYGAKKASKKAAFHTAARRGRR
jgi:DNA-binding beta-propeller fold protein YncE